MTYRTSPTTHRFKALLLAIPAVAILAVAACGSASANGSAASGPTSTPATIGSPTPTPTPSATPTAAALDTFTMPVTALGMPKSTDAAFNELADELRKGTVTHDGGVPTAAVYMSKSNPRNILVLLGVPSDLTYQDRAFQDSMYKGIAGPWHPKNKKSYPAGAMGGSIWCVDGSDKSLRLGICSVADNGGGFILEYFNHTGAQTAAALAKLRPIVEKQG